MPILLNDFFRIISIAQNENDITSVITINPNHRIFEGHFPNQPVVPGVCMVQIVKEVLELQFNKKLLLMEANQIKFLQLLVPNSNDEIMLTMNYNEVLESLNVRAQLSKDNSAIFKLQGVFQFV